MYVYAQALSSDITFDLDLEKKTSDPIMDVSDHKIKPYGTLSPSSMGIYVLPVLQQV